MENAKRVVLMYDFDKTLSKHYMSEFAFLKDVKMSDSDFWSYCNKTICKKYKMENNISFLLGTLEKLRENNISPTRKYFNNLANDIEYFNGVDTWFERINNYGKSLGLNIEHYIISSGIAEIIENTVIAPYITKIFASSYAYNDKGEAFWPSMIVNYTTKTQYIFRIKKNLTEDVFNDNVINKKINDSKEVIPYKNMMYLGDGETDVPCMKIIKDNKGHSVCLHDGTERAKQCSKELYEDKRVNKVTYADYSEGSELDLYIKKIIKNIAKSLK